LLEYR